MRKKKGGGEEKELRTPANVVDIIMWPSSQRIINWPNFTLGDLFPFSIVRFLIFF